MPLPAIVIAIIAAYTLSAGAVETLTLVNPSMTVGYNAPVGWEQTIGNGKLKRDWETYYSAPASLLLDCSDPGAGFTAVSQTIAARAGLSLLVGCVVKTEGTARANVRVEFLDHSRQRIAAQRVLFAPGTTDWVASGRQIMLPAGTEFFRITLSVSGTGKAWLDNVSVSGEGINVVIVSPPLPQPSQPADPSLRPITATPGWSAEDPAWWNKEHETLLAMTAQNQGPCDILWFGDSISRLLGGRPGEAFIPEWNAAFGQYDTLNLSINGDTCQNVLWRILHGEGEGVQPRLVVIAIGTNNGWDLAAPPAAVAAGIRRCARLSRRRFPAAEVLVIVPLPVAHQPTAISRIRLDMIRAQIAGLFRREPDPAIHVVSIGRYFLEANGTISPQLMPDFIHPSSVGYDRYVQLLQPVISKILGN